MLTSRQQEQKTKQRKIRNSEYYDMEGTFDEVYADSKKDKTLIISWKSSRAKRISSWHTER